LFEGQGVLHGDGDLRGDLLQEFDVLVRESVLAAARQVEGTKRAPLSDEWNAADGHDTLGAERANNFIGEAIELGAAGQERLRCCKAQAGRRGIQRDGNFLFEQAGAAGKIERVNFQESGGRIAKSEAGVIMMNDFFERSDDAAEKLRELAGRHEYVVHVEKDLQPIALAGKLTLISLGGLEIQRVIDGHRNLAGRALHELHLGLRDALRNKAAETHGTQPTLRGSERNHSQRANADLAKPLEKIRESVIFFRVADDKRLLRLPDPARRMTVHRRFAAGLDRSGKPRLQNVQAHDVALGVMKHQREKIEVHDRMQSHSEVVKKRGQVAMLRDGFSHFEQSFELTPRMFERRCGR
jgi:hypothetical protein